MATPTPAPVPLPITVRLDTLSQEMLAQFAREQTMPRNQAANHLLQAGFKALIPKSAPQVVVDKLRNYQRHNWVEALKKMKAGDSFQVKTQTDACSAYNTARRLGMKTAQRKIDGELFLICLVPCPSTIHVSARQKSPHVVKRPQALPVKSPPRPLWRQVDPKAPRPAPTNNVPPPDPEREAWLKGPNA